VANSSCCKDRISTFLVQLFLALKEMKWLFVFFFLVWGMAAMLLFFFRKREGRLLLSVCVCVCVCVCEWVSEWERERESSFFCIFVFLIDVC
jgi:hypothetical protein